VKCEETFFAKREVFPTEYQETKLVKNVESSELVKEEDV